MNDPLSDISRAVDQVNSANDKLNIEIVTTVFDLVSNNQLDQLVEVVGSIPANHPFHPFVLQLVKSVDVMKQR